MSTLKQTLHGASLLTAAVLFVCPLFAAETPARQDAPQAQQNAPQARQHAPQARQTGGPVQDSPAVELTPIEAAARNNDRDVLRNALRDGSPSDQTAAFDALQSLDPALAVEVTITDFRNLELGTRLQSLRLLDRSPMVDSQTVTNLLQEALHDQDTTVGDYAREALARRAKSDDGTDTVQAPSSEVVAEFADPASPNRLQILELLLRTPTTDRQLLKKVLQEGSGDADPLIKSFAANALLDLQSEEALPASGPNVAH